MNDEIQIDSTTSTAEEIEKNLEAHGYEIVRDDAQAAPAEGTGNNETTETSESTDNGESNEASDATESNEQSDSEARAEAQAAPKPKKGFQKRIDKLTREKKELESRLSALEQKFSQGTQQPQPAQSSTQAAALGKPTADQYNTYEDFLEALTDWKADQREAKREAQRVQQEQQAKAQEQQENFGQSVEAARERHEDFKAVADREDLIIPPAACQAIVESQDGGEIMYFLGKHPEIAEELQGLSPYQQVLEIGRISQSFAAPLQKRSAPVSKAPAPVKTVAGKAAKTTLTPGEMDVDTYRAWYESGGAM